MWTAWLSLKHTFLQFWALFGIFLIGGAILTTLSRLTNNTFTQFRFPRFGLYAFGWLGVPVHEFSHAFFCKVFLHDVEKVKWFDTKARDGAHGSVTHAYNPWNLYHRVGHFFIGLGPAILGPVVIAVLFYFLVPTGRELFHGASFAPSNWIETTRGLFRILTQATTYKSPLFYVFAYCAICISSQIELSREDLKQVATGIIPILIALWLGNVLAWALGAPTSWHLRAVACGQTLFGLMAAMFSFAALLAFLNLVLCTLVLGLINRLYGRPMINPLA